MPQSRRLMAGAACLAAALAAAGWWGLSRNPAEAPPAPAPAEAVAPAAGQPETPAPAQAGAAAEQAAPAPAAPAPKSYQLSAPEPPAPPEERARALAVIDYANGVDAALSEPCGQEAGQIMAGLALYQQEYDAFVLPERGADNCLRKRLAPPKDVFSRETEEAMSRGLADMDRERVALRRTYDDLCAYVADVELRDNGRRGRSLCDAIAAGLGRYARAATAYLEALDRESRQAQDTLLRDHPLRDHVGACIAVAGLVRRMAEDIAYAEPDPASLEAPLAELEERLQTASWLPFPIAGEVEMHYRHFLKSAGKAAACLRQGQVESFSPDVRRALNEAWQEAKQEYNRFVDAVNAR